MATGRQIAEAALKPALIAEGWSSPAAGWFTKEMQLGATAVLALTASSQHHAPGSASVTVTVGLRNEAVEQVVEQGTAPGTAWYQGRRWVSPLGYLLSRPDYSQGERLFHDKNAKAQADDLVRAIRLEVEPYLRRVAADESELSALAKASVTSLGAAGLCRIATLLARTQGKQAASDYVTSRLTSLGDRTDPAAGLERDGAPKVMAVLDAM